MLYLTGIKETGIFKNTLVLLLISKTKKTFVSTFPEQSNIYAKTSINIYL